MEKLTFLDNGKPAFRLGNCVYKNEIARKLYAYEDTDLDPESVVALKRMYKDRDDALMRARRGNEALERQLAKLEEENARLRELLGKIENIFTERENNEN